MRSNRRISGTRRPAWSAHSLSVKESADALLGRSQALGREAWQVRAPTMMWAKQIFNSR